MTHMRPKKWCEALKWALWDSWGFLKTLQHPGGGARQDVPLPHSTCCLHTPVGNSKDLSSENDNKPYFTVKTPAGTRGQRSTRPLHHPSPVSGVDPAGVVVNVVDVVDFAIKVSGFLPAFRKWQLGAGHVSRVSTYRAPVCAESYRREARLTHHHHRHHQQEQHQVPKHPPVRRRTV